MKFEKVKYYTFGRFPAGNKYGICTKMETVGYTAEGLPGVAVKKVAGWWYVDHMETGLGIVTVGSATRAAAVDEYLTHYAEKVASLDPERMKKAAATLAETPTEEEAASWQILNFSTVYDYRLDKVTEKARRAGLITKKADDAEYIRGGNINIIGRPEALAEIREMIDTWARKDAEKAQAEADQAEALPAETTAAAADDDFIIAPAGRTFDNYWTEDAEPAAQEAAPEPASAAESAESAKPAEQATEAEKPLKKAVNDAETPEKPFAGQKILGRGWYIYFDAEENRTRVIFERIPHADVRKLLKEKGFYWCPGLMSWNKKLTWKAYRAALALAEELQSVPPIKKQRGPKNPYYNPLAA